MTATPMRLEDALRFNGYTIDQADVEASTITVPTGVIQIPAMRLSALTWRLPTGAASVSGSDPQPSDSFYLEALPIFADAYRPVILSHILDRYSTRRIGYDTPDQFGLAVRRWMNLNLGPQSVLNLRYLSTAVVLPLDNVSVETTDKARDATSDFPQTQLAGNVDYSSFATDRVADNNRTGREGRSVASLLEEQRSAFLNVDAELLELMDSLFLQVWDRGEFDPDIHTPRAFGFNSWGW